MKKIFITLSIFGLIHAQSVVKVIPAPYRSGGLTFDGEHLWSGIYGGPSSYIFEIDTSSGNIIDSIPAPRDDCYGLTYDGQHLYFLFHYMGTDHHIYVLNMDGTVVDSLPTPVHYMAGMTYDGQDLWLTAYYDPDGQFYKVDKSTGAVLKTFAAPDNQPWGLAFDGTNLWVVDYWNYSIFEVDTSGNIITSFSSPGNTPTGATWDGQYLWIVAQNPHTSTGWAFFKIDVSGNGTPDIFIPDTLLDFGAVSAGDTVVRHILIYNYGDGDLSIDSVHITGTGFSSGESGFPVTITPAGYYFLPVIFYSSTTGEFSGTATIYSNDPDEGVIHVTLHASAVSGGAHIVLSDTTLSFGDNYVGGLKLGYLAITDSGTGDLRVDSVRFSSGNFSLRNGNFPLIIHPLNTETLEIYFSPEYTGSINDTMWIYSNDPASPSSPVELEGNAIANDGFMGGDFFWSFRGPDNVVSSTYFIDPRDSTPIVVFDSYDAGVTGPNLFAIRGNSYGEGIPLWQQDVGGGWGEGGLKAAGDLNVDGFPDIVYGSAWGDRSIYAISGSDGSVIWRYDTRIEDGHGGWVYSVDTLRDITGDGVPEVIAGAGGWSNGAMGPRCVYVFNGLNGEILFRFQANDAVISVCPIPDVDGDGYDDIIAGAGGNGTRDHHVYLVSGNPAENGRLIWNYDTGDDVWWVSNISDLDGDGIEDVVAGNWGGKVLAISGRTGGLIWQQTPTNIVMKVVPIGDVDGDGISDIAVGSWSNSVIVLAGNDGHLVWSYYTGADVWTVDKLPDITDDGINEVIAGSFNGNLYVLDGRLGLLIWRFQGDNKFFTVLSVADVNGDGYADVGGGTQALGGQGGTFYLISGGIVRYGIHENEGVSENKLRVLPTVSRDGFFTVRLAVPSDIKVFDITGRIVKEARNVRNWTFRLNHPGIYFIKSGSVRRKILVVK